MTATDTDATQRIRERIREAMPAARDDLARLVAFRSVADPRQFPVEECVGAANWVRDAFAEAGIENVETIETADGSLAVLGHTPAPEGAPTVLLYSHYDVQPPGDESLWHSEPFMLTERDGRWYGRGAADCKGNVVMHLLALRALRVDGPLPVGVRIVIEGSEEMGGAGLDHLVAERPERFDADLIVIGDSGNAEVGRPTLTTTLRGIANVDVHIETLKGEIHSGMYGGAAPDALAALIHLLGTLRDEHGNTVVDGLDCTATWDGVPYPEDRFRTDAGVLDGVSLPTSGTVADAVWARPALTVLGIDAPPVVGSAAAVVPRASARLNLRVPPGIDARTAQDALVAHLETHVPWGARLRIDRDVLGEPFRAATDGPGYAALRAALETAYGREVGTAGQGGSIPLCTALQRAVPRAEIALIGVEEPRCVIHAPNESVDPTEIENLAVAEALLLTSLAPR
ncbi:acetylornithine deacetylase/succinyl-diaminopimelate desuccinylase-like protein [Rhodococcus rhodochrous J45]|uniref:Acetylornithine deacetylase/succinyl-diaminopimelate desuccinylase-like protein n=1 Tax=Rhodococcus rhodochrous J45 TaxID=935266 RepID=A0A562DZJ9_RHORH|nr:dipeptidase [Rhodococcus rhodochrous]TWH15152.1 acetylornithine deacetylase/succinyl-diaminopimelate desuccinylase-like protein [Rhodococcus rhodochrous J45]TWH17557.1 acetylornithine deacetylase/succinyl-diaminopimelate desuccinylase-like protein [Rhodococcus rhodochrous J45]